MKQIKIQRITFLILGVLFSILFFKLALDGMNTGFIISVAWAFMTTIYFMFVWNELKNDETRSNKTNNEQVRQP